MAGLIRPDRAIQESGRTHVPPRLHPSPIRAFLIALTLLGWAGPESLPAAQEESRELEEVLKELRQVELEIEQYLVEQAGQAERDSPGIPAAPADAPTGGSLTAASRAESLQDILGGVSDEIGMLAQAKVEGRTRLKEAETGVRLSTALLASEATAVQPDIPRMLTLALIQARHRRTADLAVEQLLRLEQVRPARAREPEAPEPVRQPQPLPEVTRLDELRDRHRDISERLSRLSASVEESRREVLQLRDERAELNALMGRLSGGDGTRTTAAAPTLSTGPETVAPLPASTRQEGRRAFWRAGRARIHALTTGRVLFAGAFGGYRHLLILEHDNGWTSIYGNMTECFVSPDQVISSGSVLGEYQAEAIGDPEPFWLEVRHETQPAPIESLPGLPAGWADKIFDGKGD